MGFGPPLKGEAMDGGGWSELDDLKRRIRDAPKKEREAEVERRSGLPAFPVTNSSWCDDAPGLSKREWIAGLVIQQLAGNTQIGVQTAARMSVQYADALLNELESKFHHTKGE